MKVENSITIDRSVGVVWRFFAIEHVRNHPRWDPDVELAMSPDGPIDVGSVIQRRVSRFGKVTKGSMECVVFDPERAIEFSVTDGPMQFSGGAAFESLGADRTHFTSWADVPGADQALADAIHALMQRSVTTIKSLIETET